MAAVGRRRGRGSGSIVGGCAGAIDAMPLWAESVDGVKGVQKAGEIVPELADEAEQLLRHWVK